MVENLINETWVSIQNYEDGYSVSDVGRIKALKKEWHSGVNNCLLRKKDEVLLNFGDNRGYKRVVLTKNGVQNSFCVHRLVAKAFIPNPENKPQINHKNGVKSDNRVGNLEWATPSENLIHAIHTGLHVPRKRSEHSQAVKVKCTTLDISFGCIKDAADALGLNWGSVWKVCAGRLIAVRGLTFRYL